MKRIEVLDVWRSFSIVAMMLFHLLYDLNMYGVVGDIWVDSIYGRIFARCIGASFMLLSGAVCRFSRRPVKRGMIVLAAGYAVSIVMSFMGMSVQFGILHLMGCSMILTGLARDKLKKIKSPAFPLSCLVLFFVSLFLTNGITVEARWLYPLGLRYHGFSSVDYYPLIPYGFIYLAGFWLGGVIEKNRARPAFTRSYPKALTFLGRHSLEVYLIHQPVFYGVCWILLGRV